MKRILFVLIAGSLISFNSCTKTGPQGPQGPKGATGAQGNANVIGSDPFTPNWTYSTSNHWYTATFNDEDITTDVVDRGIVQIFKSYGTNIWTPLPDISGITSTVFDFTDGSFTLYIQNSNGSQPAIPGSNQFRVVVVYPSNRLAHPNTNWQNYNEAVAAINADKAAAKNQ